METLVDKFNLAMEIMCLGLYEKKKIKEESPGFSYSKRLKKALDIFSLLNYYTLKGTESSKDFFPVDEAALIKMASRDIEELIIKLPEHIREEFLTSEWYQCGPLINLGRDNCYYCSEELLDLIMDDMRFRKPANVKNKELELESQKFIQELFNKTQEEYCEIRYFLQQKKNSYITQIMFLEDEYTRGFKQKYNEIFEAAYERLISEPKTIKVCTHCGLVLKEMGDGTLYCVSERCSRKSKGFSKFKEVEVDGKVWVLKENVARYIYYPGILEQKILKLLKKYNIEPVMWPKKDTWDFEFYYNGELWAIDAKDVKNPMYIIKDIEMKKKINDEYDKVIYIVPSSSKAYLNSIKRCIGSNMKFACMSVKEFQNLIESNREE